MPRPRFANSLLLIFPLVLLPQVRADPSYVFGNVSNSAPFEIPASLFHDLTSKPAVSSNVSLPGYNVSDPNSDSTGGTVGGWTLSAAVTPDIPLEKANNNTVDKSKFTEATILGISRPDGQATVSNRWKVCATVYLGGVVGSSTGSANQTPADGSCASVLPGACIEQMMVWGSSSGVDAQGKCSSPGLQTKCEGHIGNDGDSVAFALTSDNIAAGEFLAYGSSPINKGNRSALDNATETIWPVVVSWGHVNQQGEMQSTNAYVSCVRASDKSNGGSASGGTGENGKNAGAAISLPGWVLPFALGIAVLGL